MSRCVIFHKQLGDLVLLQPCLYALARSSAKKVDLRTYEALADVVSLMPDVQCFSKNKKTYDQLWCLDTGTRSMVQSWRMRASLKTLVLNKETDRRKRHGFIFDRIVDAEVRKYYRVKAFYRMIVGKENEWTSPRLQIPGEEWNEEKYYFKRYLVVSPSAAWQSKSWRPDCASSALKKLNKKGIENMVLVSDRQEWQMELCDEIEKKLPFPVLNLAGKTSLRQYLYLISRAHAVLAVDGASSHLASAFHRPCLTLFGPANPLHWHHPTATSFRLWAKEFNPDNPKDVAAIPVDSVVNKMMELYSVDS